MAPFWLPESIENFIKFHMDFLNDFGTLWAPFWLHFGVVLGTKFGKEKYRNFKSLPGAILGAPGSLQARKVWFYLSKTRVFEDGPFRA